MGAGESTGRGGHQNANGETQVVDYYQILEVGEDATADDIKRSFRRLALIHHPDKNHLNVEEATRKFATIQQAYEVLSDEQERAWYDTHRASLVPEPDAETVFEDIRTGANLSSRARDRGLTVRHLTPFFDVTIWDTFHDAGERSFFTIYRNLFTRLSSEELMFDPDAVYPVFGHSAWPWSGPSHQEDCARSFYNIWMNFSTAKDFAWSDQWNISEAPERRIRRLMEKDNKKAREDARREYNDTVRSLVKFVRKRDPRYKKHQETQALANSNAAPKQQSTSHISKPKASRTYVEQEWQKVELKGLHADLDWAAAEGEDEEEWECVACRKTFRSEAAWDSHERSKKHMKEVERLRWEMQEEDEELELEVPVRNSDDVDNVVEPPPSTRTSSPTPSQPEIDTSDTNISISPPPETDGALRGKKKARRKPKQASEVMEPEAPEDTILKVDEAKTDAGVAESETTTPPAPSKRDKRRAREAKKAEEARIADFSHRCNICSEVFPSKTKLFSHITDTGHALAVEEDGSKPQKSKKKRR